MDMESEIEIKEEELDLEYDSNGNYLQIFPDSGEKFDSPYSTKIEELSEMVFIKSEFKEITKEPMLDEEWVNNSVIKTEMIEKLSPQHVKSVADHCEQGSKMKSTESRPLTSITFDQTIEENIQECLHCRFCNFTFKQKEELMSHIKTHDRRKFKCAHCSYECNYIGNLKAHLLTHSSLLMLIRFPVSWGATPPRHGGQLTVLKKNLKLFKCSECTYECKTKGNLKRHMLTHSNLLFKCSECSYDCNNKSTLIRHQLTHSNSKLFKCSECSYECNHKSSLKIHLLTHSNSKLFKCSECSYECNHKDNLKSCLQTDKKSRDKKGRKNDNEKNMPRDEKRARAMNLPISCEDIINLPMDEFNERMSKYDLSEAQLSLTRNIRKRGKNKVAAQNCRKRKLDQIVHLAEEVKVIQCCKNELNSQLVR